MERKVHVPLPKENGSGYGENRDSKNCFEWRCRLSHASLTGNHLLSQRATNELEQLVALAEQLRGARELVRGRTIDRIHDIALQMEHLHQMAKKVLEDANLDEQLHSTACNLQKIVGKVYHLYETVDGTRYMSLLSPDEWNKEEKMREWRGSFRLEADRSWTPLDEVRRKDEKLSRLEHILCGLGKNSMIKHTE